MIERIKQLYEKGIDPLEISIALEKETGQEVSSLLVRLEIMALQSQTSVQIEPIRDRDYPEKEVI